MVETPIYVISPHFHPYVAGAEQQGLRASAYLIDQYDLPIQVVTRRHSPALPDDLPIQDTVNGVPIHRVYTKVNSKLASLLFLVNSLTFLIRHRHKAIYHALGTGTPAWIAILASRLTGGCAIVKFRIGVITYQKALQSRNPLARWQMRGIFRLANYIIAVNTEVERWLVTQGVPQERIVMMPNGLDTSAFPAINDKQKQALRDILGLSQDKKIFVYVGRLSLNTKDVDTLIKAWARLKDAMKTTSQLLIIGKGKDEALLRELISQHQLQDHVQLVGYKANIRDYYQASDVFVLASRDEGLSNALLEAMASQLPVVTARVAGALDIIEEGVHGYLYTPEDVDELAQKLQMMWEQQAQWAAFGQAGRDKVIAYADMSHIAEGLQTLYQRAQDGVHSLSLS